MKKIITLLMLFCFLISCERKEPNFSDEMIEMLADRGEIKDGVVILPPPLASFTDLYFRITNNEIVLINGNELYFFYKKYYSTEFKSYKDFLNAVLNDEFIMDKELFKHPKYPKRFKLNAEIKKEYSNLGFNEFLKKYSKPSLRKKELILNKSNLKEGQYLSVTYLLYINKYDISSDCYLGVDYIRKREDSFK
ncbi:MAG: hypothetical protein RRY99_08685 [Flavobacterium sp.]